MHSFQTAVDLPNCHPIFPPDAISKQKCDDDEIFKLDPFNGILFAHEIHVHSSENTNDEQDDYLSIIDVLDSQLACEQRFQS
jgi:hypothetical protein